MRQLQYGQLLESTLGHLLGNLQELDALGRVNDLSGKDLMVLLAIVFPLLAVFDSVYPDRRPAG
jgi:hypothetical protein